MLGFTKDPFPCVRNAALQGLVRVCDSGVVVEDSKIIEGCFFRSVELLNDHEDYVRLSAIRAVSQWGCMLAASKHEEEDTRDWYDGVFLQICSMVRDMNVGVRVEAFTALGRIAFVSQDILLQTLSKKVLVITKEKQSLTLSSSKAHKMHSAIAAGAFVHGLEDEYNEVKQSLWAIFFKLLENSFCADLYLNSLFYQLWKDDYQLLALCP
ncbi:Protein SIEL [Bienertia sinuspersici]